MTGEYEIQKRYQTPLFIYIALSTIAIFSYTAFNPLEMWDMLGYAASVHALNGLSVADIHAIAYAEMKSYAPLDSYQALINGSSYRTVMSSDPEAFSQQIPYYKIRLFFILLINALTHLGLGSYEAMHLLSAAFGSIGFLLVCVGFRKHIHPFLFVILTVFFYGITSDFMDLQKGGVDSFAFFWMTLTFICYVNGSKFLLPLLALSVLVRTDLVIHAALLFSVVLLTDRNSFKQTIAWGIVTLALYFLVNNWAENYGWRTLIHFVFVSDMSATHPAEFSMLTTFNTKDYIDILLSHDSWISKWFWLSLTCAPISFILYFWSNRISGSRHEHYANFKMVKTLNVVCLISVLYVVLHYLLFPAIYMRFFIGSCFFMVISMLCTLSYVYQSVKAAYFRESNLA